MANIYGSYGSFIFNMSSIYKKSRDGYYYYQTYIYDDNLKKNSKKYHSLRTKDYEIALKKKKQLDLKYEKVKLKKTQRGYIDLLLDYKTLSLALLLILSFNFFKNRRIKIIKIPQYEDEQILSNISSESDSSGLNKISNKPSSTIHKAIVEKSLLSQKPNLINKNKENSLLGSVKNKIPNIEMLNLNSIKPNINSQIITNEKSSIPKAIISKDEYDSIKIPPYNVERKEKLSGSFKQLKIFITTNQDITDNELKKLCLHLKDENDVFSNLIVCAYSDNDIGIALALGDSREFKTEEQRKSWLLMYTSNPIEGDYFDFNPSDYFRSD